MASTTSEGRRAGTPEARRAGTPDPSTRRAVTDDGKASDLPKDSQKQPGEAPPVVVVDPTSKTAQHPPEGGASEEAPSGVERVVTALTTVPDWVALHPLLACYLAEGVGTFLFVLTVALVCINNPHAGDQPDTNVTSLPIGFMLMCMVFTFGYVSGGHFNPCVTFAVMITKMDEKWKLLGYMLCQCGAAFGAGIVTMIIKGSKDLIVPEIKQGSAEYIRKGLFSELIFSFALATVVLHVACSRQKHNFFYGFSIGMVIVAGACSVGGVSGGAFNPALATGLQAAACFAGKCSPLLHFWLYWLAPMVGAGLAALAFMQMDTGLNHE